ncbi:MAG: DUF2064 domain-containing protein [Xanthomonadaceae bacterium]|nr:DUF2064 domain-containing protein [Xanthomonadaceae bacterium]MBU6478349.1 DUF2064 domain-containing protein [Xanthomonadaceae bacterium]MDE2223794.1 DUF2064 domain-containing protein [Xanthomonadaceae bacterium]
MAAAAQGTDRVTTAVAIFVKTPGHSPVKTRLARAIGHEAATEFHLLAAGAVAEVVGAAQGWNASFRPYWAVAECGAMDDRAWCAFPRLWQGDGELGDRLDRVYAILRTAHERVLLIGADAPQVTPELLRQARMALDDPVTPFVMGEAEDGGFWLFGGRAPILREVWCKVGYSRDDTASQLCDALRSNGEIAVLPTLTDVDRPCDLPVLAEALAALRTLLPAQLRLLEWLEHHSTRQNESIPIRHASMS